MVELVENKIKYEKNKANQDLWNRFKILHIKFGLPRTGETVLKLVELVEKQLESENKEKTK